MTTPGQNNPSLLRRIIRDVVVVLLAEVVIIALAWCLSARGRAVLARMFRRKRPEETTTTPIIDV
jgi:hypothetical protein